MVRFIEGLGVRKNLSELGFVPEQAEQLAESVSGNLQNDPAYRGRETVLEIYRKSFE